MSVSAASGKSMDVEATTDDSFVYVYRVAGLLMDRLSPYPYTFTYVGIAIRILQFLGFVLNPLYTYNFMFMKQMAYFVFLFSGPFFDRHYGPLSLTAEVVIVALLALVLALGAIFFVINCVKPAWEEHTHILKFIRLVIESTAGWFFIPMMHLCLGGLPCSGGLVRNFPETKCGSPTHIAGYVFSVIGIILCVGLGALGCLEFNPDPHSNHILARAHGYCDFALLATTTIALIFFHILLDAGHATSFSIMMMVLAAIWFAVTVLIVPYYNLTVLSLFTGTFLTVLVIAFVNCLTAYNVSFLTSGTPVLQCTIVFSIIPAVFVVGYLLGPIRVNSDFLSKLHKLHFYGYTPEHVALFPFPRTCKTHNHTVAPPSMLAVHTDMRYEIKVEEREEAETEDDTGMGEVSRHRFEFFVPYVSTAIIATDSEVATRFLRDFRIKTGGVKKYTSSQLLYTLNMYFKALGYFKQSAYVLVSMGWFLLSYCNRQAAVLELVNHIHNRTNFNADYMVGFKFYRLEYIVKESLGYRGAIYILALQRAHLFHRQALGTMVRFWTSLQEGDSVIQLLVTADELARLRRTAFHEYHLALTTNKDDRNALIYLASFIEDLLHQKDIAEDLRNAISEMELDKKNKALLAAHSNQGMNNDKTEIEFRAVEKACEKDQTIRLTRHGNERCFFFLMLYYSIIGALGLLAGMLVVFIVGEKFAHRDTAAIFDIYRVKASGYSVMYNTEALAMYSIEHDCDKSGSTCVSDLKFVQILQEISSNEQDMRVRQNRVTFGSNSVGYTSKAFDFAAKGLLPLRFFTVGTSIFEGLFTSQSRSLVNLYFKLSSILTSVSTPQVEWLVAPTASAYITTMVNCIQKSVPYNHYMQFVTDGGLDVYLAAMEPFVQAVRADISSRTTTVYTLLSILLVLALIHVVLIVTAHYSITAWSTKNRIMLINLFRKVPQASVEDLRAQHALTLSSFRVSGENVKRDEEFTDEEEEEEDKNSEKVKANMNAFRSALVTVLQSKPGKSCIKQVANTGYGPKHTVRFCLTSYDLTEHPQRKLHEPGFQIKGSKTKIVEDFEKSLEDIDEEVKRERVLEQQRRDTYTEHLVTSGYRYQWRRIKERIASWGNSDSVTTTLIGSVISFCLLALGIASIVLIVCSLDAGGSAYEFEKTSINQLKLLYSYVASFDRADVQASVFCNFFYQDYLTPFVKYSLIDEQYLELTSALQNVYDNAILQLVPYSETLFTAVLRPTLSNIIYVALAARAGLGLTYFDLASSPYISMFTWGLQESDPTYLSQTYPRAFDDADQYVIPPLSSDYYGTGDPAVFYNAALPLHRRDRFFDDVNNIREALSFSGEKIRETALTNIKSRNSNNKLYVALSFSFCAILMVGLLVGIIVGVAKKFGRLPLIYLSISLVATLVAFILLIIAYKKQDDGTKYISTVQTVLEEVSQFRTFFYRRLVEVERYLMQYTQPAASQNPTYLKSIRQYRPSYIEPYLDSAAIQFPSMQSRISTIKTADSRFWDIEQISLFLLYASTQKKKDPSLTGDALKPPEPFIQSYNYKMEPNYASDVVKYQNDKFIDLMYSNSADDLQSKDAEELFNMARFAVFGLRGANYFFTPFNELEQLLQAVVEESVSKLKATDDKERVITICALVFVAIAVLFLVIAILVPIVRFLRSIAEGPNAEVVREALKVSDNVKIDTIILISLGVCVLVVVFFILAVVPINGFNYIAQVAQNSGERLGAIQRSMAKSLYVSHSFSSDSPCLGMTATATMTNDLQQMTDARDFLYYSSTSSKSGLGKIKTFSSAQRELLFESNNNEDSIDTMYRNWMSVFSNIINIVPEAYVPTSDPQTPMKDIYSVTEAQMNQVNAWVAQLEAYYPTLVAAIQQSDDMYATEIQKSMAKTIAPAIALYAFVSLGLLICVFAFVPTLALQEKRSEEDIRPILGALPKAVIDSVPSLSLFADSGIIDETTDAIKSACALSPNALQFVENWKTLDESDLESGYAELETNPNACILTTETGIIVAANSAALNMFKHDSLSGKEVGILMDQGAAEMHSRMMAYYVENRGKRKDGPAKVDVQAYTKNMDSIHVVVVLAEATLRNDRLFFLAEIYLHSRVTVNS